MIAFVDPKLLKLIESITAKRPRTVLDHILKHGQVTTEELKRLHGYSHPPRAARDVRECGIPLKTTSMPGPDGRPMAVYTIDESAATEAAKTGGRRAVPKMLREAIVKRDGGRCALCGGKFPARALQADHRIPYEIAGDTATPDLPDFMLVCGSCNRAKSWSCEQCPNWIRKERETCVSCLWASPRSYAHVAMEPRRRLDIVWEDDEVTEYDRVAAQAKDQDRDVRDIVKAIIRRSLRGDSKGPSAA
jgi:hypothetical protein